jgi:hypothetical protein
MNQARSIRLASIVVKMPCLIVFIRLISN